MASAAESEVVADSVVGSPSSTTYGPPASTVNADSTDGGESLSSAQTRGRNATAIAVAIIRPDRTKARVAISTPGGDRLLPSLHLIPIRLSKPWPASSGDTRRVWGRLDSR